MEGIVNEEVRLNVQNRLAFRSRFYSTVDPLVQCEDAVDQLAT
jgi:hypothetical protein